MKKHITLIFLIVFSTHFFSKVSYITDSRWTLHTAWAIAHQHNLQLDRFKPTIEKNSYYAIEEKNGHLYYTFPPGTPLLCAPLLVALEIVSKKVFYTDIFPLIENGYSGGIELFLAALFVALSAVFVYLILKQWQVASWLAVAGVVLFAYGTSAWSTASRGLFAHGPGMLFLLLGFWSLLRAQQNVLWLFTSGAAFGYSYAIRPTSSIPIIVFSLYVLYVYRLKSWQFFVAIGFVLSLFFTYNLSVYNSLLSNYYLPSHMGKGGSFLTGLTGSLFSPSRGLFIYTPAFILILPVCKALYQKRNLLLWSLLFVVLLHTYVIASFNNWYSGWCFGARYFAEAVPYLVILLILGIHYTLENSSSLAQNTLIGSFMFSTAISCYINYQGANNPKTFEWNYSPSNIDENRNRVWDWNDPQFLR